MPVERFEYKQDNNCDIDLRDCRIEIRSKIEISGLIRLNIEVFDKFNERKIAMLHGLLGGNEMPNKNFLIEGFSSSNVTINLQPLFPCMSCDELLRPEKINITIEEDPETFMYGLFSKMRIYRTICLDCYAKWLLEEDDV